MTLFNEARANDGLSPTYSGEDIYNHGSGANPYRYPDLNFISSDYLQSAYMAYDATVEISGGNDRARYYTNVGYWGQGSLVNFGDATRNRNERINVRGNIDAKLNDFISARVDAALNFRNDYGTNANFWGGAHGLRPNRVSPLVPISMIEGNGGGSAESIKGLPEGAELGPHGIMVFHDYEDGLAYAKEINKPIMLDFTGYACVNCRKMEDYVWSDKKILSILKNEVVLISLYVDDKKELAENEKYVSKETGKRIKTIGNKWSDFQITKYKANAQPYYLILDTDGNTLSEEPASYDPDINLYEKWLRNGIDQFTK